jgi:mannose-6-phosphate isomerase-like protein (cupin superfamily)
MRAFTLLCFSLMFLIGGAASAQTSAQPAPATAPPAQAAPAPRRAPAPAPVSRSGIALTVTDTRGLPIPGVRVTVAGPSDRSGETDDSGQVNFVGMQPGTYRVRFDSDKVVSFEREVTVRSGQPTGLDVTLNMMPPPPPPPAAPPRVEKPVEVVGPPGMPQILSIVDLAEKQLGGNAPRRETLVACSGNTRTMLVVLNQDQPDRLYDSAETEYYVVAGQGAVRLNGRETPLAAGSYASIPRNTGHSIVKRGNRPLILLSVLSGEPCEEAK